MDKAYWLRRERAAMAMAHTATCSEARLIHYDLAGRYSVRAARASFMLPRKGPATEGEREALRPLPPAPLRIPDFNPRPPPLPRGHSPGGEL